MKKPGWSFLLMLTSFGLTGNMLHAQGIDSIVIPKAREFMQSKGAKGLSVGVYLQGKNYTCHFGTASEDRRQLPNDSTLYVIASITKTFTGLLLARAVVENKASLNDDVRQYLEGEYPNLEYAGEPVKLYHLISHVSRLPFSISERAADQGYTRGNFYHDLRRVKLDTLPGIKFQYSNAAARLLGYVLENIYQQSFESLVKEKIAYPLNMRHTCIVPGPAEMKNLATGYTADGQPDTSSYNALQAAGGLKSTISDLLQYMGEQIREDNEAVRLTRRESWGFDMGNGSRYSCGLNWQIITKPDGTRRIFQDGNVPGYSSKMIFCPETGTGIVVLSNAFLPDELSKMADETFDQLQRAAK